MRYSGLNQYINFKRIHCTVETEIYITCYGYEDFTHRKSNTRLHKMADYTLQFIEFGKGTLNIKGHIYNLEKNHLFYLPKDTLLMYTRNESDPYKYFWISIDGNNFEKLLKKTKLSASNPVIKIEQAEKMLELFKSLDPNKQVSEIKLKSVFYTIFDMISDVKNVSTLNSSAKYDLVQYIIKYIQMNYSQSDLSISSISEEFHLNPIELSRLFKNNVNMSPRQYITNYRMEKAKNMLEAGISVSHTSNNCGFSDIYYFSRAFKKHFGYPPSQTNILPEK